MARARIHTLTEFRDPNAAQKDAIFTTPKNVSVPKNTSFLSRKGGVNTNAEETTTPILVNRASSNSSERRTNANTPKRRNTVFWLSTRPRSYDCVNRINT